MRPVALVAGDPALNRAGRQADGLAELAQRAGGVLLEQGQQVMIDRVKGEGTRTAHATTFALQRDSFQSGSPERD
jgi:hypothetical protein